MEFSQYQVLSKRTLADLGNNKLDLAHMVLGMCAEYNELVEAINKNNMIGVGEECSDAMWFISNYYTLRGYDLKAAEPSYQLSGDKSIRSAMDLGLILLDYNYQVSKLQDLVKAFVAYDRIIDNATEIDILNDLNNALGAICFKFDLNIRNLMKKNINKLLKRYPDKFSKEDSENRDLDSELEALKD